MYLFSYSTQTKYFKVQYIIYEDFLADFKHVVVSSLKEGAFICLYGEFV